MKEGHIIEMLDDNQWHLQSPSPTSRLTHLENEMLIHVGNLIKTDYLKVYVDYTV